MQDSRPAKTTTGLKPESFSGLNAALEAPLFHGWAPIV